jgi:hypothetical protein
MLNAVPFPYGRFTEAEWFAAFALSLPPEDAAREAAFYASLDARETPLVVIDPSTLACLALVSPALAARVEAYRRGAAGSLAGPALAPAAEQAWRQLLRTLRRHFGGGAARRDAAAGDQPA